MNKRPNIILIYTDQHRYDALGSSGNSQIHTPNLNKLAAQSMVFDDCHVSCPLCVPSRVATWRGVTGKKSSSYTNNWQDHIKPGTHNFAGYLKKHGFTTALIGKNHCFQEPEEYFDFIELCSHTKFNNPLSPEQNAVNELRKPLMQVPLANDPTPAEHSITHWCCDRSLEYLKNSTEEDKPFFLWLSIPDPHPPFMVSEPYASMYDDVEVPPPIGREGEMLNKPFRHQLAAQLKRRETQYPHSEDLKKLKRIYWAMVSQIDEGVGRIIDYLENQNKLEETIIVFTADHGEYLGDHNLIRKGATLYDCLTHVPFMMSWKNQIQKGFSAQMASNLDIFPTLFDLLEIPIPQGLEGKSLAAQLQGAPADPEEVVISHFGFPGTIISPEDARTEELRVLVNTAAPTDNFILHDSLQSGLSVCARNRQWTFVSNPGDVDELYDRINDPHELKNLAHEGDYSEQLKKMSRLLEKKLIEYNFTQER
jgi:arylsulfatase